jgi:phosphoglycolate phosphatase-like HAD superfamily hydrolase
LLLLFDIDGTLLSGATDAHRDALHAALREVHGVDAGELRLTLSPAGRTDGEIARALLLEAGISARQIEERSLDVLDACCRHYALLCTQDLSAHVLAGVPELLEWCSTESRIQLALVTGNFECVARLKLRQAGIGKYFRGGPGAFGSDSEDRAALPAIARRRAGKTGAPYPREQTIVIGDTPRDIACAHADEVRCIAVATGPYGPQELSAADDVVADAAELRRRLSEQVTT